MIFILVNAWFIRKDWIPRPLQFFRFHHLPLIQEEIYGAIINSKHGNFVIGAFYKQMDKKCKNKGTDECHLQRHTA